LLHVFVLGFASLDVVHHGIWDNVCNVDERGKLIYVMTNFSASLQSVNYVREEKSSPFFISKMTLLENYFACYWVKLYKVQELFNPRDQSCDLSTIKTAVQSDYLLNGKNLEVAYVETTYVKVA